MSDLINKAIIYCVQKHGHQGYRKMEKIPYVMHPLEVATIITSLTDDENVIIAGVLHDVLEDTDSTEEELRKEFGDYIVELVLKETENKRRNESPKSTWKIRKIESINELKDSNDINVKILWLSDKLSNMRSLSRAYKKMGDECFKAFNNDNKEDHKWYYNSVLNETKELQDSRAWKELNELVEYVFGGNRND